MNIPGVYKSTDPAVNFSIWGRETKYNLVPGPAVWEGGASAAGAAAPMVPVQNNVQPASSIAQQVRPVASASTLPTVAASRPAASTTVAASGPAASTTVAASAAPSGKGKGKGKGACPLPQRRRV